MFELSEYPSITSTSFAATITLTLLETVAFGLSSRGFVSIKFALNLSLKSKSALKDLFSSGISVVIQYLSVIPSQPVLAFLENFFS